MREANATELVLPRRVLPVSCRTNLGSAVLDVHRMQRFLLQAATCHQDKETSLLYLKRRLRSLSSVSDGCAAELMESWPSDIQLPLQPSKDKIHRVPIANHAG